MSLAAIAFFVSVLAGLTFLGVLAWRLFTGVRSLGRTVAAAAERIEAASANLPETNTRPYTEPTPRPKGTS